MTKNPPCVRNTIHIPLQCNTHRSGGRRQKVVHGKGQPPLPTWGEDMVVSQLYQGPCWIPSMCIKPYHEPPICTTGDVGSHSEHGDGACSAPSRQFLAPQPGGWVSAGTSDEPYSGHKRATHHHRGEPWAPSAGPGGALTNPVEKLTTFHPGVTSALT